MVTQAMVALIDTGERHGPSLTVEVNGYKAG